ncbi:MAG: hypothetical protein JNJ54_35390 [Myxococcaceae bacterium]|nr:hypothetical protein [Myxococcaceae bacterium]
MVAAARVVSVVVLVLVPGALVVATAWVLARLVSQQLKTLEGTGGPRLARAVAAVRWSDVVREARALAR